MKGTRKDRSFEVSDLPINPNSIIITITFSSLTLLSAYYGTALKLYTC